jgi:hypothetical protein
VYSSDNTFDIPRLVLELQSEAHQTEKQKLTWTENSHNQEVNGDKEKNQDDEYEPAVTNLRYSSK